MQRTKIDESRATYTSAYACSVFKEMPAAIRSSSRTSETKTECERSTGNRKYRSLTCHTPIQRHLGKEYGESAGRKNAPHCLRSDSTIGVYSVVNTQSHHPPPRQRMHIEVQTLRGAPLRMKSRHPTTDATPLALQLPARSTQRPCNHQ